MLRLKHLIFILLFTVNSLQPLTILHVTSSTDDNPGGEGDPGDLRYCLNQMNSGLSSSAEDHVIVFDFDTDTTIQLNGILPIINNSINSVNITIGNTGSISTVTIDGQNSFPGFFIPMGNVTIQNITFQNMVAQGGTGGDGISGGGGGLGAGVGIFAPRNFLNGSDPAITLINVSINNCSAIGGNGGSYIGGSSTGNEGGGGGGGLYGNGGSITTVGTTGGAGGGGLGGNGGDVTTTTDDPSGGGGGGGGGIGSRASAGPVLNSGNGGPDNSAGSPGNGYYTSITAGTGGGNYSGGNNAGGGGGGNASAIDKTAGGGGGGSQGTDGVDAKGAIPAPPGGGIRPSGGTGGDGGGGGGGSVVIHNTSNSKDGTAGDGGYAGGGGGGGGTGAYDTGYSVTGGRGGLGGGGGGGGVNISGTTPATGGDSLGGGGGGGGGPSSGTSSFGGSDIEHLGGGSGGSGYDSTGPGAGGGGGGGGSGLGGAIFVDSNLNFTIKAFSSTPTVFNTSSCTVQGGLGGAAGSGGGNDGTPGSTLGNSIFLRTGSSLTFMAENADDVLTLGNGVAFVDDTTFGTVVGSSVLVKGNGTVIYNGTTEYQGRVTIDNATFKVNGQITDAPISVCRDTTVSTQRGTLSGSGILTGNVTANSGTISPDAGEALTLGSLTLNSAGSGIGSLVHIEISSGGTSLVSVTHSATLAGILEIDLDPSAIPGSYTILTSSGITGTFDSVSFTGRTPNYTLSYLPEGSPTFVQFNFLGYPPSLEPASDFKGVQKKNNFGFEYELYNRLTWTLSSSPEVTGYFIYRNGKNIATVNALRTYYIDHNMTKGVFSMYSLVAFDAEGNTSSAVTVTVP